MLGILHGESRPGRSLARRAAGEAKRRAFTPVLQHEKKTQRSTDLCDLLLLLLLLFGRAGGGLANRPPPKPGRAAQAERPGARDEPGEGTARRTLPRGEAGAGNVQTRPAEGGEDTRGSEARRAEFRAPTPREVICSLLTITHHEPRCGGVAVPGEHPRAARRQAKTRDERSAAAPAVRAKRGET
jgi:hypothetical protein